MLTPFFVEFWCRPSNIFVLLTNLSAKSKKKMSRSFDFNAVRTQSQSAQWLTMLAGGTPDRKIATNSIPDETLPFDVMLALSSSQRLKRHITQLRRGFISTLKRSGKRRQCCPAYFVLVPHLKTFRLIAFTTLHRTPGGACRLAGWMDGCADFVLWPYEACVGCTGAVLIPPLLAGRQAGSKH